jgi:ATP-dependent Clp protease ATP-binding subunit ClpA
MPPFNNFTTKAKEAIRRAHELAIERGQNHVSPLHLLAALIHQEESLVFSVLDRMEVDTMLLADTVLETLERRRRSRRSRPPTRSISRRTSPRRLKRRQDRCAHERSVRRHRAPLPRRLEHPGPAADILARFKITKTGARRAQGAQEHQGRADGEPKRFRALAKYTRNLTKLAQRISSTRSSAAIRRSIASSRSSRAAPRTIRCSSAKQASARPLSPKGLLHAWLRATCRNRSKARSSLA